MIFNIKSLNVILIPVTSEEKEELESHPSYPDDIYEIYKIPGTANYYMMPDNTKKLSPNSSAVKNEANATEKAYFFNGSNYLDYDFEEIIDRPVYMVAPTKDSLVGGYQIVNLSSIPLSRVVDGSFEIVPDGSFSYANPRN